MSKADYAVLYDPELVAMRERHMARLDKLFAGEPFGHVPFTLAGQEFWINGSVLRDVKAGVDDALRQLAEKADGLRDEAVFRPLTLEGDIYGVHFIDKMFGAEVMDIDGLWQSKPLDQPVGRLEMPDLDRDPTWRLAREIADAFVANGVTVPFFGMPTIASPLVIAVNLFAGRILEAMVEKPDAARHDLRVITDFLISIHKWYQKRIPAAQLQMVVGSQRTQPRGFGQLCGCTTQLLSAQQYREFVAPLDAELLRAYPHGGMIHLCGAHLQHLPTFRAMKELRAIQHNGPPTDSLLEYFTGTREDQILYVFPTEKTPLDRIMSITNGRRMVIVQGVPDMTSKKTA